MTNKDHQYNRYGERDVRPGHFQHGGGQGSLYRGQDSSPYLSMPTFEDEYGMTREEEFHEVGWSEDPRSESFGERHYGKGPRNWPSDEKITQRVLEGLYFSREVDAREIEVRVESGKVYLTGSVADRKQKKAAENVIENISGVVDVQNELMIRK